MVRMHIMANVLRKLIALSAVWKSVILLPCHLWIVTCVATVLLLIRCLKKTDGALITDKLNFLSYISKQRLKRTSGRVR